jgi:hypothetical protein
LRIDFIDYISGIRRNEFDTKAGVSELWTIHDIPDALLQRCRGLRMCGADAEDTGVGEKNQYKQSSNGVFDVHAVR